MHKTLVIFVVNGQKKPVLSTIYLQNNSDKDKTGIDNHFMEECKQTERENYSIVHEFRPQTELQTDE